MAHVLAFGAKKANKVLKPDTKKINTITTTTSSAVSGAERIPKAARVKNKMPAEVQITAEQLLREASERMLEQVQPPPKQPIKDVEELSEHKRRKRKLYEDNIRKNRGMMGNWIKYAQWEHSQKELERARSIYERALNEDSRNIGLWLKYAEMEMKEGQVNHARNLWNRAITILPRADQFWFKFSYMEEMLGNVAGARQVFERWMEWEPDEQAWFSFIKMELRYKEVDRAKAIYERFVRVHPETRYWIKFARFEEQHGHLAGARSVYERGMDYFGEGHTDQSFYMAFAKFEERQKEYERVRTIYKYALDKLGRENCTELFKAYSQFEKRHGDRQAINEVITNKRRIQYEAKISEYAYDYDAWFNYIRLMETEDDDEAVREVYERAIANVPPVNEKRYWRRYIYFWINYALFEELTTKDMDKTRAVYEACITLVPHKVFTFAKMWIMYAHFEVRQLDITRARRILGTALGRCPKQKIFRTYIELETELREFDRIRTLYGKCLEYAPMNATTWIKFAELETILGDIDRGRAIYNLAIDQPALDMPEVLWKTYIDFEIDQGEYGNARQLYERLLTRTQHIKVWLSYAAFEISREEWDYARTIYSRGYNFYKDQGNTDNRKELHDAWALYEEEHGNTDTIQEVKSKQPTRVKLQRQIPEPDGVTMAWEEFWGYTFPDDLQTAPNIKLLKMAKMWKQKQADIINNTITTTQNNDNDNDNNNNDNNNNNNNNDQSHNPEEIQYDDSDSDIEM